MAAVATCRGCGAVLDHLLVDLGLAPLANAFIDDVDAPENFYPLRAYVCTCCYLAQLPSLATPAQMFNETYAYFSSANPSFVEHARRFASFAMSRLGLTTASHVIEIASNDGYLLQAFKALGVSVVGIEPSANVAEVAESKGIPTRVEFFGLRTAYGLRQADLIVANNVLAHVPDLHDFIEGMRCCLAPSGTITVEFPHALNMIVQSQFDQIYFEHFSYFTVIALEPIFAAHRLQIVAIEKLPTHGGSLRLWIKHEGAHLVDASVSEIIREEIDLGLDDVAIYDRFRGAVTECRNDALVWLIDTVRSGYTVAGFTAPAKGSTFLNYAGIRPDLLPWTVDSTPSKIWKHVPGVRIPIYPEEHIATAQPDFLLVLAWNWLDDCIAKARSLGYEGKFVTAIPQIRVIE